MTRHSLILTVLMLAAVAGAIVAKPSSEAPDRIAAVDLDAIVPSIFGDWQQAPLSGAQVVNPQAKALLDKLYSQVLTRNYVTPDGYVIMLSIAYGSDQRGGLQAHKPEVCYPAQGFTLHDTSRGTVASAFGDIPVTRLSTSLQSRVEPVTYWFTVGDETVQSRWQKRLVELRYGLTGQIPDGLLFRVSSIDPDSRRAYRMQERFVTQLLESIPASSRHRLAGLASGH